MAIDLMWAFENEPPPLDFIWSGFLSGTVGALVAPGATGKSYWALEAAMCIASSVPGGDVLQLNPSKTGRVIYLAGEDPEPVLLRRIHAIGKHLSPAAYPTTITLAGRRQLLWPVATKLDRFSMRPIRGGDGGHEATGQSVYGTTCRG